MKPWSFVKWSAPRAETHSKVGSTNSKFSNSTGRTTETALTGTRAA